MSEDKEKVTEVTPTKEDEDIAALITKRRGNISAVARNLKVARKTVYHKIKNSAYLQDVLEDSRETMLDNAEDKLGLSVKKGEAWAICFVLKTQGKSRGYVEKQEIQHSGSIEHKPAIDLSKLNKDELVAFKELLAKTNAE
jgi:hypothetical protein